MIEFDGDGAIFLGIGLATLAAALLPRLLGRLPISVPMVFLAGGMITFALVPDLPDPSPTEHPEVALHLTEICVIVSLMGAGLALNRIPGLRRWSTTWRLLAIAMPLTMLAIGVLGWWALGLGIAGAALLAAALAPTDPVLATELQVTGPVGEPDASDDETRFALTSEAGLNDGLAFPFTWAAIAMSLAGVAPGGWFAEWLVVDVLWRTGVGVLVGLGAGWLLGKLFFSGGPFKVAERAEGFVALAATFFAYGAAELAEGYGFIAVFVCACAIRAAERTHDYHGVLHKFVEQTERLLTVVVVVLLGGAITRGLLAEVGVVDIAIALVFLLVIRPVAGWLALTPGPTGPRDRAVIAVFGVRGVGSLFYIAFALSHGDFPGGERLWALVSLVVVGSILLHGIAATPVMRHLDRVREQTADRKRGDQDPADSTV